MIVRPRAKATFMPTRMLFALQGWPSNPPPAHGITHPLALQQTELQDHILLENFGPVTTGTKLLPADAMSEPPMQGDRGIIVTLSFHLHFRLGRRHCNQPSSCEPMSIPYVCFSAGGACQCRRCLPRLYLMLCSLSN